MLRNTPVFGDPKTDFVFQRIFGREDHKTALLGFLNDILQLDEAHTITSVTLLPPEQRPEVSELQYSIVQVQCIDVRGTTYVVAIQVLNLEPLEKPVLRHVAKTYTNELDASGAAYPKPNDLIGISVCDFELWPHTQAPDVPMLSRWHAREQQSRGAGVPHVQLVFLELPKYQGGPEPQSLVDKWAYFFRETENLKSIPDMLCQHPFVDAFERARIDRFTRHEWDAYINAGMALQDVRGAFSVALRQGKIDEKRENVLRILKHYRVPLTNEDRARILACADVTTLARWFDNGVAATTAPDVFNRG